MHTVHLTHRLSPLPACSIKEDPSSNTHFSVQLPRVSMLSAYLAAFQKGSLFLSTSRNVELRHMTLFVNERFCCDKLISKVNYLHFELLPNILLSPGCIGGKLLLIDMVLSVFNSIDSRLKFLNSKSNRIQILDVWPTLGYSYSSPCCF